MANNRKKTIWTILIFGLVMGVFFSVLGSGILGSTIDLTPVKFNPVYVDSMKYVIRDVDGTFLDQVSTESELYHYHDSQGRYPDVDIMFSQPFPCESDGTYVTSTNQIDHSTSRSMYVDGKLYFLSDQYYWGVDICARTYTNPTNWKIAPEISLNPLRGINVRYTPWYTQFTYTDPGTTQNPDGNLILGINTDCNTAIPGYETCVTHKSTVPAKITTSLYPMQFQVSTFNPAPAPGYQLTDAIQYIQNYWGTKPVIIQPEITIKGYNDYIRYSYNRQVPLPNGTLATVKVDTTSAKVGFVECYKSPIERKGAVPNYLDPLLRAKVTLQTDRQTELKNAGIQPTYNTPQTILGGKILQGSVLYKGSNFDEITTIGAEANVYGALAANGLEGQNIKIDLTTLDQFSLPTEIKPKAEFELQEISQLYIAQTDVTYSTLFWNGAHQVFDFSTEACGTTTIKYPYKLEVQNVYAISRIVFRVAIISENNPTVYVSGKPIDPEDITDFELTSYGLNPTLDDFIESKPPIGGLDTTTTIIIVILVVAVVITGLVIFRRRESSEGSKTTHTQVGIFVNKSRRAK